MARDDREDDPCAKEHRHADERQSTDIENDGEHEKRDAGRSSAQCQPAEAKPVPGDRAVDTVDNGLHHVSKSMASLPTRLAFSGVDLASSAVAVATRQKRQRGTPPITPLGDSWVGASASWLRLLGAARAMKA